MAQSVLADSLGRVWVGTYAEGLWRIEGGQTSRIADDVVGDGNILALFEDSRGRVWFGGGHQVAKFEAGQFQVYGPQPGLPGGGATCFASPDGDGRTCLSRIVINVKDRMVLVNTQAEKVFGYDRDELIGEPIEMLIPERFRPAHRGKRARRFRHAAFPGDPQQSERHTG